MLFKLAWLSILSRRGTAILTIFAIAISVSLLLGIEQLRKSMRNSFLQTVSGIDLVVGARGDAIPVRGCGQGADRRGEHGAVRAAHLAVCGDDG